MNFELIILILVLLVLGLPLLFIGGGLVVGVLMTRNSEHGGDSEQAAEAVSDSLQAISEQKSKGISLKGDFMDRALADYFPLIIIFGSAVTIVAIVFAYKIVMVILQARLDQHRPTAHREQGLPREAREQENVDALAQKARDLNERVKNLEEIFGNLKR